MKEQLWTQLKNFDAYPKPLEDFRIKTLGGGAVTIISTVIMALLFISELYDYLTPKVTEELFVDTTRSHKLRINIDITLPKVACSYLTMDAMDSSGEHQTDIEHTIFKRRVDAQGNPMADNEKIVVELGESKKSKGEDQGHGHGHGGVDPKPTENVVPPKSASSNDTALEQPACGSCYGAENSLMKCCNTCDQVREAYRLKGWALTNPEGIEQCKAEVGELKKIFDEGCQIYGFMEVNRVSGSFHIAPGKSFSLNHVHVHDVQPYSSNQFNMSHKINDISFGEKIPGKDNPIHGVLGIATQESTMFQYYLKVVPTTYEKLDTTRIHTNQFSTTRHEKVVGFFTGESGMPGVFFSYEISPIMVKFTEKSKSFGHFATAIVSIIGGIFTVAGILDATIYKSSKILKKYEIGKLG